MRLFGDSSSLTIADDHVTACFKFVCSLYDKSHKEYNINYLFNAVPEAIVELVRCKWEKGCKTNVCGCKKAGLTCTDVCICNEAQQRENQNDYYCYDSSDDEE